MAEIVGFQWVEAAAQALADDNTTPIDQLFEQCGYPSPIQVWGTPTVANPSLIRLLSVWQRLSEAEGGVVPARRAFDPLEVPALMGHMVIVEALTDGDFRYRLVGTDVVRTAGADWTGRTLGERSIAPELLPSFLWAQCLAVVRRGQPLFSCHVVTAGETPRPDPERPWANSWERLLLPFSSIGDGRADQVLTARLRSVVQRG
ncbi:MAG: PAS domain-containing protein [Alphaproteobacteria bacterium]|nr:PAS domain-containing protein [Alphaproteobacteria bacterium]